jgi:hypothetical protein
MGASRPERWQAGIREKTATGMPVDSCSTRKGAHNVGSVTIACGLQVSITSRRSAT